MSAFFRCSPSCIFILIKKKISTHSESYKIKRRRVGHCWMLMVDCGVCSQAQPVIQRLLHQDPSTTWSAWQGSLLGSAPRRPRHVREWFVAEEEEAIQAAQGRQGPPRDRARRPRWSSARGNKLIPFFVLLTLKDQNTLNYRLVI